MKLTRILLAAAASLGPCQVAAKAVFAHFMVGNAANYTMDDWKTDIRLAQDAHIDAFVLNIAHEPNIGYIMPAAFTAAANLGFKLFFSFDYAGNGAWPKGDVASILITYTRLEAYYKHNGKYLVSTFEGPESADDWIDLKAEYNVFFMPDWSSLGAKEAMSRGGGVADGLFSWAAWPWGPQDMDTYTDASYLQYLGGKPYMMPVSPWFFTNLPGYNKNWLWRGDSLWYDRWVQAAYNKTTPGLVDNTEFIQIISWNDYGESHYIGPLYDKAMEAFSIGRAPSNFAQDMPHDGWRLFLPYVIDLFKMGTATITQEGLTAWYRLSPGAACESTGTTGNTASQLQIEFSPSEIVQDRIFFSALLTSEASITVTVGGVPQPGADWTWRPHDKIGVYHGSVSFSGTGNVVVTLSRNGVQIAQIHGKAISPGCTSSLYNAWVGSATVAGSVSAKPSLSVSEQKCINGTGTNSFRGLCGYGCEFGYCPTTACTCRQIGKALREPDETGIKGYPIAGLDASYSGLCSWNCNHGYCPPTACSTAEVPLVVPSVSAFAPPACRAGTGQGALQGLCQFSCNFGFCPRHGCTCTEQGALVDAPPAVAVTGRPISGLEDYDLCNFACSHGYCPDICIGSGSGNSGEVSYPPDVWRYSQPEIQCLPPCKIILPPYPLGQTTTITFRPMITSVWTRSGGSTGTKTTTILVPPLVTDAIPFWPVTVGSGVTTPVVIHPLQSFMPPPTVISLGADEVTFTPVPSGSAPPAPSFPGTPHSATVQPQATSSVPVTKNVPSLTWSSARATATCTSGCGTDGCQLFGGCSSSDPLDNCGAYGCGGGCSVQGCDQTCGLACSSDQYHVSPDGYGDQTSLPMNYDGPDGANHGSWNPKPIDTAFASSVTSAVRSEITAARGAIYSIASSWDNEALKPSVRATATSVHNALSTHSSNLQAQLRVAASNSNNADFTNVLHYFDTLFRSLIGNLDDAATVAVSLQDPGSIMGHRQLQAIQSTMKTAEAEMAKIQEQISEYAGDDICESNFECLTCNPPARNLKRAIPSCEPSFSADPGDPINPTSIPAEIDCPSLSGVNHWTGEEILDALKQAVKYRLSPLTGAVKPDMPLWQYATKGGYPHYYFNSDALAFNDECETADSSYNGYLEFPIIPGGVLSAGKNGKPTNVGTDRVVYKVKGTSDDFSWIYCGLMTHHTPVKVEALVDGKTRSVLPFKVC